MSMQTLTPSSIWTFPQKAVTRLQFKSRRLATASLSLLLALVVWAFFADAIAPYSPQRQEVERLLCPPQIPHFSGRDGWHVFALRMHRDPVTLRRIYEEDCATVVPLGFWVRGESYRWLGLIEGDHHVFGVKEGTRASFHLLGSDRAGRDIFSRLIFATRISLSVGFVAVLITTLLGLVIGGASGYWGGWTDLLVQRAIEVVSSIPHLPLWLAVAAAVPSGSSPLTTYFLITLAMGLLSWGELARVVRGRVLALREEDYVMAAHLMGASPSRVLFRHLLPGLTSHVLVVVTTSVPIMILGETALSFLGLGLRAPVVSWGVMLQDAMSIQSVSNYPWLLMPAVMIVLTVICFNFVGDGLRDRADPYTHTEKRG